MSDLPYQYCFVRCKLTNNLHESWVSLADSFTVHCTCQQIHEHLSDNAFLVVEFQLLDNWQS